MLNVKENVTGFPQLEASRDYVCNCCGLSRKKLLNSHQQILLHHKRENRLKVLGKPMKWTLSLVCFLSVKGNDCFQGPDILKQEAESK